MNRPAPCFSVLECRPETSCYRDARRAHAACTVCGSVDCNPHSLCARFIEETDGSVSATYLFEPHHQGYDGLVHGGMVSTLLDAAMTHCLFARGIRALTAELTVRFVAPTKPNVPVELTARVLDHKRRTYQLEARMMRGSQLLARATAKFIHPRPKAPAAPPEKI